MNDRLTDERIAQMRLVYGDPYDNHYRSEVDAALKELKRLGMKDAFIEWAMETPGVYNYPEEVLRREMEDTDTYMGIAWLAWSAAWRAKR